MITAAFLQVIDSVLRFLLGPLPNIPDFPEELVQPAEGAKDLIHSGVGLVAYLYSPLILGFVFLILISVINFGTIYNSIMWAIRRLRTR